VAALHSLIERCMEDLTGTSEKPTASSTISSQRS